jgi:hypothetical protein
MKVFVTTGVRTSNPTKVEGFAKFLLVVVVVVVGGYFH